MRWTEHRTVKFTLLLKEHHLYSLHFTNPLICSHRILVEGLILWTYALCTCSPGPRLSCFFAGEHFYLSERHVYSVTWLPTCALLNWLLNKSCIKMTYSSMLFGCYGCKKMNKCTFKHLWDCCRGGWLSPSCRVVSKLWSQCQGRQLTTESICRYVKNCHDKLWETGKKVWPV